MIAHRFYSSKVTLRFFPLFDSLITKCIRKFLFAEDLTEMSAIDFIRIELLFEYFPGLEMKWQVENLNNIIN